MAPAGASLLVAYRHNAITSFRATRRSPSAAAPPLSPNRRRYHCVSALAGCHRTHCHASCRLMVRRRRLPARSMPTTRRSRHFETAPRIPQKAPTCRRSERPPTAFRQNTDTDVAPSLSTAPGARPPDLSSPWPAAGSQAHQVRGDKLHARLRPRQALLQRRRATRHPPDLAPSSTTRRTSARQRTAPRRQPAAHLIHQPGAFGHQLLTLATHRRLASSLTVGTRTSDYT